MEVGEGIIWRSKMNEIVVGEETWMLWGGWLMLVY